MSKDKDNEDVASLVTDVQGEDVQEVVAEEIPASVSEPEPEAALPTPEPKRHRYQVGTWKGMPNYGCPHCHRFKTPNLTYLLEHIEGTHPTAWLEG